MIHARFSLSCLCHFLFGLVLAIIVVDAIVWCERTSAANIGLGLGQVEATKRTMLPGDRAIIAGAGVLRVVHRNRVLLGATGGSASSPTAIAISTVNLGVQLR